MKAKTKISAFEFAIMQIADPEEAKKFIPSNHEDRLTEIKSKSIEFASKIKVKP